MTCKVVYEAVERLVAGRTLWYCIINQLLLFTQSSFSIPMNSLANEMTSVYIVKPKYNTVKTMKKQLNHCSLSLWLNSRNNGWTG